LLGLKFNEKLASLAGFDTIYDNAVGAYFLAHPGYTFPLEDNFVLVFGKQACLPAARGVGQSRRTSPSIYESWHYVDSRTSVLLVCG